jgi:transmembrane sensor
MTRVVQFPSEADKIRQVAAAWVVKIENQDLSAEEQKSLNNWLQQSPKHKEELYRLANLWDSMSEIGENINSAEPEVIHPPLIEKNNLRKKWHTKYMIAACFSLFMVIPLIAFFYNFVDLTSSNGQYTTDVGEQRSITLSDGSEIFLNTNSLVNVSFSRNIRLITLQKGEANFDVAPNKSRPFIVKASNGDVRALGTSFSVRLEKNKVNVLVSHGTVRVRAIEDEKLDNVTTSVNADSEVTVGAGNHVIFDNTKVESVIKEDDQTLAKKLYWKQGFLAFDDEKLSDVVTEISRYTRMNIVISDPQIAELRVGGFYPINNLDKVFTSLELNLGLTVEKIGNSAYHIKKT